MSATRTTPRRGGRRRSRGGRWSRTVLLGAVVAVVAVAVAITVAIVTRDRTDDDTGPAGVTGADFHSLVADPTNPDRLFVGGHDAVSVSNDGGRTWSRIHTLDDADAMGWGFADEVIWVSGHPGITRSADGGSSFERRNDGLPDTDIHAFGAAPDDRLYGAGPNVGVISSTDGGASWEQLTAVAGHGFFGRIIVDATDPDHLLAADAGTGPVESADGGRNWRVLTNFPTVWVSATDGLESIVASQPGAAIRSTDGGATWEPLALPAGASLVEIDPTRSSRLYAGIHDGERVTVMVSDDNGVTWRTP